MCAVIPSGLPFYKSLIVNFYFFRNPIKLPFTFVLSDRARKNWIEAQFAYHGDILEEVGRRWNPVAERADRYFVTRTGSFSCALGPMKSEKH